MTVTSRWQFWIDRGGTFTDCLGRDPGTGRIHQVKVLSADRAPLIAIRRILGLADDQPIPPSEVRMGTTIATNALLERRGAACALVITRGFRDLLEIGNQARPHIFELDIRKPELLYREVIEVDARLAPDGQVLARPDAAALRAGLEAARQRGARSLAVVVLHAYLDGTLERDIGAAATAAGFDHVSLSSEVAAEIGMVGRGDTTVVDAYLTPLLRDYVAALRAELPGSTLRIMQSSGGLTDADRFRGRNAVLSGPAGGVVAYAHVARACGMDRAIGFDMGGTSTDVSAFDGAAEREYETEVAGVRLRAPMMAIHTVAAGGGSLCRYQGYRLTVGPESAGASPGPLCYGDPAASELAITDINLALGRVVDDRFPFPLERRRVDAALARVAGNLADDGQPMSPDEVAAGFFAVANASMAEAIRQVSVARGRDVRDYALVVFGGAGGQHACPLARELGIRTLIFDRFAGVLSAYGMGLADVTWHGEADAGRRPLDTDLPEALAGDLTALAARGRSILEADAFAPEHVTPRHAIDLRYRGTDTSLTIEVPGPEFDPAAVRAAFEAEHAQLFGYARPDHVVEAMAARVEVIANDADPATYADAATEQGGGARAKVSADDSREEHAMWTGGRKVSVPILSRDSFQLGQRIAGPALVLDATGTIALDEGWELEVGPAQRLIARDRTPSVAEADGDDTRVDPVRLEIFNNLFMSVATQMGNALQRTAVSTNIRERLDFSCALFDAEAGLVANAPHIPVHLGAMGESVKAVLAVHPQPAPGQVFVTNDPAAGGSHLPDVTVVTPVHDDDGRLIFFTASRGHHADIGGITPGSMPPFSSSLTEEGVVFRALPVVSDGRFDQDLVMSVLTGGPYPARNPRDNLADLEAQIAANRAGAHLLGQVMQRFGVATVLAYMRHVQDNAAARVAAAIRAQGDGTYEHADAMDDGTPIRVTITVTGERMRVDFAGSGPQSDGNLNAPRAVSVAAVIYVLRTMVGAPIPLNSGCLRPVEIAIPAGSILSPDPERAVAGGNVETSQRVVDVLLGALGRAAASQGTMNNLTFGTERFGYYETIAGGAGATPNGPGASGVHTHMTNTRITDPEILESRFPVRLLRFSLRPGSGGAGHHRGGDGVVREYQLLSPMRISILSERRSRQPFGLAGGEPGAPGRNLHGARELASKVTLDAAAGETIRIETPGGGGHGPASSG